MNPWDERSLPSRFTLKETKLMVERYEWLERFVYEVMGGWIDEIPENDVKFRVGTHCYHHAWHSELWQRRMPQLGRSSSLDLASSLDHIPESLGGVASQVRSAESTVEKLVALYRVLLPRLVTQYTYHLNGASSVTDAPTMRVLRFCLSDLVEDAREGESMLQAALDDDQSIDQASSYLARLEKALLSGGGLMGGG